MQKKIKNALITILATFAILAIGSSTAKAETVKVSPTQTIYKINGSERMYRYIESNGNYQNVFCFDYGARLVDNTEYTVTADIYNLSDSQITEIFGSTQNYNKALWVADNMFITQNQSSEDMTVMVNQLKQILHTDTSMNAIKNTYGQSITEQDIDDVVNYVYVNKWYNVLYSIEQCVFWNYTNNVKSFSGLTKLDGGFDLQGKYYMWIYTGLNAVANTKGNYYSPNKNNAVTSTINALTMDCTSAEIDMQNKKIGPFIVNGYNSEIITDKSYQVRINGQTLNSSEYTTSFDGKNLYVTITSSNYDLEGARVYVTMSITGIKTRGQLLYKKSSQDLVSFQKTRVPKTLTGLTENTEFDLRLIKNIEGVWSTNDSTATVKYDLNSDELKSRNIQRVPSLKNGDNTESWKVNKYPVTVATGDIVKYAITIANEGTLNGYAAQVNDYIADGLELVSKEELVSLGILNNDSEYYNWKKGESSNGFTKLYTTYLSNKQINAYNKDTDTLDTKVIYVYCKVTSNETGALLKNVAEIAQDRTHNTFGVDIEDRDSTPGDIQMSELSSSWKGNNANLDILSTNIHEQYFYPGKYDDDDFETVRIQNFDLALTKQITNIENNDASVDFSRLTRVNADGLKANNATTADYIMDKSPVSVSIGTIVTYKISVYNEGNVDAYAKEITDYLPAGLEFYSSEVDGINYNWNVTKNSNGTTTLTTDYLANEQITALTDGKMDNKFVEVKCKVVDPNLSVKETNIILTNVAEITKYGYYAGNNFVEANKEKVDRDSKQKTISTDAKSAISDYEDKLDRRESNMNKADYNYEDDDDFENVVLAWERNLDLALRKSISAVNGNNEIDGYNLIDNRLPHVDATSASDAFSSQSGSYFHDKEAIKVKVGDEITYTIRVFNEGNIDDYYGYAKTITDYLPDGVEFIKIADSSAKKWTTKNRAGDKKIVLTYTSNKTIPNTSLLKWYAELATGKSVVDESDNYQEVSIICKVTGIGENMTNRAEISSEVATDEDGNIIENINDKDSVPDTLNKRGSNYDNYYDEYDRRIGINDTYVNFYPGEENGSLQDDVDFEAITVEPETGKVGLFKYEDTNKNGQYDDEDKALRGAKFALKDDVNSDKYVTDELETDNYGKVVFEGLELDKTYYIIETYTPVGFKKLENAIETVSVANDTNFEDITNLVKIGNEAETTEVSGTKTWNDNQNQDGIRPESITVKLLADGVEVDSVEVTEASNWTYKFENLDKYKEGKEIVYTVDESEVAGYTKSIEGYNLTNTHIIVETTEVSGTKTWNDNENKYGKRPETITIYLLANGQVVDSVETSEAQGWSYNFTDLDSKDEEGNVIAYTIDEETVEGYTKTINGYDLTNTYNPETIEISGIKTWVDENDKDQIRPQVLVVKLYADGQKYTSVITTSASNWSYKFTDLPKYNEDGNEIVYTVDEDQVEGYTKKVDGYNLTNTHVVKVKADLALRKFITEVNGIGLEGSREPAVDTSSIATTGTATYTHPKDAVVVNTGDVVTYTLRIYNEGKIDAAASKVKDDIPEGLEYIVNDATNIEYGWRMIDAKGNEVKDPSKAKYVITDYLAGNAMNAYAGGNLDYRDVKVSFKVISEDVTEKELINYAQISEETDSEGNIVEDSDSIADVWVDGEDDQDIEKIILTYSDLSLRKFITKVNDSNVNPSREPVVDTTPLLNGETTATYTHPKDAVVVSKDDIVRYTIRIYNEGTKSEYVTLVKDSIPEGVEFITSSELNQKYGWKMVDELGNEVQFAANAKYVVTSYLSSDLIKAYDKSSELDYKDVEVEFKVIAEEKSSKIITNYAQISDHMDENGNAVTDRDSTPDEWIDGEDDQDIENIKLTYADLALRKYITEVNSEAIETSRVPQVDVTNLVNETSTEATYTHPKDPVEVQENDIVTYTLRVYNEGTKSLNASKVKDDIPEGLEFVPYTKGDGSINDTYRWKLIDENGKEVTDVSKAKYIITDYLANDLIKAFDKDSMETLDYRDVKVSFKVLAPTEKDQLITNYAQISEETDESGNVVSDIDSTADVWNDGEDDQDTEVIKLKYFDLALQKWVSEAIIIENGTEKVVKTGYTSETNPEPVVKVDLKKSKIENVVVKFKYSIQVTNQGEIAGFAKEVEDRIPAGLKFVASDNNNWQVVDGRIVTYELKDTLLQPGESATVSIVLTWINKSDNLGLKTNIAEITEDADGNGNSITDIDSTPNNNVDLEDDQDNATVMLTIKTGDRAVYTTLILGVILILGFGIFNIKKHVLK